MSTGSNEKDLLWLKIIEGLIALGAFSGSISLFIFPDGAKFLNIDKSMLDGTPFSNYLIPAIILFVVIGLGNIFGLIMSIKNNPESGTIGIVLGILLIGWLSIQFFMIGFHFLQPIHALMALFEIWIAFRVRNIQTQSI